MVQVVQNQALVTGRIASITPSERGQGWVELSLVDDVVEDVPGFPNLVAAAPRPLRLRCAAAMAAGVSAGDVVRLRARLAGPGDLMGLEFVV